MRDTNPNRPIPRPLFTAVVLAGDRAPDDPVVEHSGACCKALVPVGGIPMVLRVLQALADSEYVGRLLLCGPSQSALAQSPELQAGIDSGAWQWMENRVSPSRSAAAALASLPESVPVLLTTADHALLRSDIVDYFCGAAVQSGFDLAIALARYAEVMAANPGVERTGLRFGDDTYAGCNLFAFLTPSARRATDFWCRFEQERKRPWRLMRALGWLPVLRYLLGRLTLAQALDTLSIRLGTNVGPILLPFPEAAIDVDKVSDWRYVQRLLAHDADTIAADERRGQ